MTLNSVYTHGKEDTTEERTERSEGKVLSSYLKRVHTEGSKINSVWCPASGGGGERDEGPHKRIIAVMEHEFQPVKRRRL